MYQTSVISFMNDSQRSRNCCLILFLSSFLQMFNSDLRCHDISLYKFSLSKCFPNYTYWDINIWHFFVKFPLYLCKKIYMLTTSLEESIRMVEPRHQAQSKDTIVFNQIKQELLLWYCAFQIKSFISFRLCFGEQPTILIYSSLVTVKNGLILKGNFH